MDLRAQGDTPISSPEGTLPPQGRQTSLLLAIAPHMPPTSLPWDALKPYHPLRAHNPLLTLLSPLLHSSILSLSLPQYSTQFKSAPKAFKSPPPPQLPPADVNDNNSVILLLPFPHQVVHRVKAFPCLPSQPFHAAPLHTQAN